MKNLVQAAVITLCLAPQAYSATPKVIYGDDNRVFAENSNNDFYQKLAQSTAVQLKDKDLQVLKEGETYSVNPIKLEDGFAKVCADEEFSQSLSAGNCSGFLVGDDLLVTAGHCVPAQDACAGAKWAFNYQQNVLSESDNVLDAKDVYSCVKIINQSLSSTSKNDFALIQLDRKVEGREPLKFRTEGKVDMGTELVIIGHPSGLPTIIADDAWVRRNDNDFYFVATTDSFGGNSGSAVLNAQTGEVEGILVRGEKDYVYDAQAGCNRPKKCENDECRGEDVTRITVIPELAPGMTPAEPQLSPIQLYQVWVQSLTAQQLYMVWYSQQSVTDLSTMIMEQTLMQQYQLWLQVLDGPTLYGIWFENYYSID